MLSFLQALESLEVFVVISEMDVRAVSLLVQSGGRFCAGGEHGA